MKITKSQLKSIIKEVIEESMTSNKRLVKEATEQNDIRDRVEFYAYYDNDMSQINFDENFVRVGRSGNNFVYTEFGNLSDELPDLSDITVKDGQREAMIKELANEYGYDEGDEDYNDLEENYTDQELFYEIATEVYGYKSAVDLIKDEDFPYFTNVDNIIGKFDITGYSQGDYATVYVDIKEFEKGTGRTWNEELKKELENTFKNLFYDSPMYVRAIIDGDEYYVEEFDGMYEQWKTLEYDKNKAIEDVLQQYDGDINKEELKKILEEIAPDELGYERNSGTYTGDYEDYDDE